VVLYVFTVGPVVLELQLTLFIDDWMDKLSLISKYHRICPFPHF